MSRRGEATLIVAAVISGLLFFASLDRLWPLVDVELERPHALLRAQATDCLDRLGFDLQGYADASELWVETAGLDYVDAAFGRARTQQWLAEGLPLVGYRVLFRRPGERTRYAVSLHPNGTLLGWRRTVEEDEAGPRLEPGPAREVAEGAIETLLGIALETWESRSASAVDQIDRRDHTFGWERRLSVDPELREWLQVSVAGDRVVAASRSVIVPGAATRDRRAALGPGVALETIGFALLTAFAVAAFFVFLGALRDGRVHLRRAAVWPAAVFVCLIGTYALQRADLFAFWEPLWPKWVSDLRYLVFRGIQDAWLLVVLLAVVAAGDALDRQSGAGRGSSLWALGRGRWTDPAVAAASWRGFLVGLLCGGAMTAAVVLLGMVIDAPVALQPRGFFFYTLNSAMPTASSLLFFFGVALAEELGYRFFGGGWVLAWSGRRWLAVLLPALIYGLTHTRLDFLPPAGPFWGRALVFTLVGCVWGWAFLRYDALTVVLSHFTADLFIFNWPRLATGRPGPVVVSVLAIAVPLLPALLGAVRRFVLPRRT